MNGARGPPNDGRSAGATSRFRSAHRLRALRHDGVTRVHRVRHQQTLTTITRGPVGKPATRELIMPRYPRPVVHLAGQVGVSLLAAALVDAYTAVDVITVSRVRRDPAS